MTIDTTPTGDDLYQSAGTVYGTVGDATWSVTVNGAAATVDDAGNWEADNVPIYGIGTATFDAVATPPVFSAERRMRTMNSSGNTPPPPVSASLALEMPAQAIFTCYHVGESDVSPTRDWTWTKTYFAQLIPDGNGNWQHKYAGFGNEYDMEGDYFYNNTYLWSDLNPAGIVFHLDAGGLSTSAITASAYWQPTNVPQQDAEGSVGIEGYDSPAVFYLTHYYADPADVHYTSPDGSHSRSYDAHSAVTLYTGGKAKVGRQNLFCINATAGEHPKLPASWFFGDYYIDTPIPSTDLKVGSLGYAGSDGNLWKALPDNSAQDITINAVGHKHYTATASPGKYKLKIQVNNTTTLDPDVIVDNAKYCVGQKLTFSPIWDSDPGATSSSCTWEFSGKFVNHSSQASTSASVNYDISLDLLNVAEPYAWWYSGGNKNAYVHETLHFSNGQSATVSASGQFNMFKPTASIVRKYDYGTPTVVWNSAWGFLYVNGTLQVGTGVNHPNSMDFYGGIQSQYHGYGKWVQIIDVDMTGTCWLDGVIPDINPSQTGVLDNQDPFGRDDWTINANVTPSGANNTVPLDDSPAAPSYGQFDPVIRLNISATDYLMFKPDGDSIWVPLGKTATPWAAHCNVEWPTIDLGTGSYVSGPGDLDNSTAFPSWTDTLSNP